MATLKTIEEVREAAGRHVSRLRAELPEGYSLLVDMSRTDIQPEEWKTLLGAAITLDWYFANLADYKPSWSPVPGQWVGPVRSREIAYLFALPGTGVTPAPRARVTLLPTAVQQGLARMAPTDKLSTPLAGYLRQLLGGGPGCVSGITVEEFKAWLETTDPSQWAYLKKTVDSRQAPGNVGATVPPLPRATPRVYVKASVAVSCTVNRPLRLGYDALEIQVQVPDAEWRAADTETARSELIWRHLGGNTLTDAVRNTDASPSSVEPEGDGRDRVDQVSPLMNVPPFNLRVFNAADDTWGPI